MSYEPLHHKYRPKSFAELVGQEAIATTLTNAIQTSRIAPAYLFTGPRGTGKTSSARILAKSLNCLSSPEPTATPCEQCEACQGISKGYAVDVIEIDAASNTGVDNIREIIERSQFAPIQCRYKVYVVDECHMLSTQAFNALLKTLEEPPKHIVFVLATTDPQRVLPTIISRCQRFDFRRIPLESMIEHLTYISTKEDINISEAAIILIAQLAQGGLRDAESLLDQLSLLPGEVVPDRVWDLVGSVSEKDLLLLLSALALDNAELVIDSTRKILDRGREPLIILQNLAGFYRDLLIAKTAPSRSDLVACTQETWQNLVQSAQSLETSAILAGQSHLRSAEVQLKNTTQPRLWLEVTLLGLLPSAQQQPITTTNLAPSNRQPTYYPQQSTNQQPTHQQPVNQQPPNQQPVQQATSQQPLTQQPANQPVNQQPANQPLTNDNQSLTTNDEQDLTQVWQHVLSHLEPVSRRELLRQMCHVVELKEKTARLGIKQAWFKRAQADLPIITAAFSSAFQREIRVDLEVATSTPEARGQRSNPPVAKPSQFNNIPNNTLNNTPTHNGNSHNYPNNGDSSNAQAISIEKTAPTDSKLVASATSNYQNGNGVLDEVQSLPTVSFSNPIEIAREITKPAQVSTERIELAVPVEVKTLESTQPQPIAQALDANAEQVIYAAERLAQFFDGQVIGFSEDTAGFSDAAPDVSIDVLEEDD